MVFIQDDISILNFPSLQLLVSDVWVMFIIIEVRLLDWHFHTSWHPVQVLIKCGPQFRIFAMMANATHAMVTAT